MGGTLAAIENGFQQSEIQNAAYEYQRAVESGETIVVGVNRFRQEEETSPPTFRMDPEIEKTQVARLRELRATRPPVDQKLDALEQAARGSDNLMPQNPRRVRGVRNGRRNFKSPAQECFGEYRESLIDHRNQFRIDDALIGSQQPQSVDAGCRGNGTIAGSRS